MENNNSGKKLIAVVIVIIVLAIVLAIWFSVRQPGSNDVITPEQLSFREAQQANELGALDVPDQFPGSIVYVSRVDLPAGGFVVIRKNDNGSAGDVIGQTFFDKDTRIGNVDLDEPIVDGQTYLAQAWTDDGDAQFGTTDKIVTKADGSVLEVQFRATTDLPEKKG